MAEILPIRRKTLYNQSMNQSIKLDLPSHEHKWWDVHKSDTCTTLADMYMHLLCIISCNSGQLIALDKECLFIPNNWGTNTNLFDFFKNYVLFWWLRNNAEIRETLSS